MLQTEDRRRKRSSDPLIALHYQLSHARSDGSLETLVLADPSGVVVAGAGSWAACEELAAYAPLFARIPRPETQSSTEDGSMSRILAMRSEVEVRELTISGQNVFLCARGHSEGGAAATLAMDHAAQGISRILSAA
ncbi:hypothetical protein LZC95_17640 [Pendulispora brunnea]|uniref:Roadblock/LAMTOR2 domain-containing protein n=1 Tax=Pendulispora brunnea TaxID=2905690 RepID=A0ABZ2KIY3_9BACT